MAYPGREADDRLSWRTHLSDRSYFWCATALYAVIILAIVAVSMMFLQNVWMVGDTNIFYDGAGRIIDGQIPYLDFQDPKPPLIFFTLVLPSLMGDKLLAGLLLVGLCNLISAVIVMKIAWNLYGRLPGFLAGLVFTLNLAWAEGYFVITEPFTLTFLLLSTYAMLFLKRDDKYLISGICAGIAIGYKQYALLLIPISLYIMYRKGELRRSVGYMAGVVLSFIVMFGAIFLAYGMDAGMASLHWSFGIAGSYITQDHIGDVPGYRPDDPVTAVLFFVLGISLLTPLMVFSLLSLLKKQPMTLYEECFMISGIAFAATIVIRPFLHYWALALPFIVLLCVRAFGRYEYGGHYSIGHYVDNGQSSTSVPGGIVFSAGVTLLYGIILLIFLAASAVLMQGQWRPYELQCFYGLADIVLRAVTPYLDYMPHGQQATILTLSPPSLLAQGLPWGLILAGICDLASAVLIMKIADNIYGRSSGLFAGLLFISGIAWVQGYFTLTESLALTLILLSLYLILFADRDRDYLISGVFAGVSVLFKPYALLLILLSAYALYRKGETSKLPWLMPGVVSSILIVLAIYGTGIPVSMDKGIGIISIYDVNDGTYGQSYDMNDPLIAMVNIAVASGILTSLAVLATGSFFQGRPAELVEVYFLAALMIFISTILLGMYLHYWIFALPFIALLCSKPFGDGAT